MTVETPGHNHISVIVLKLIPEKSGEFKSVKLFSPVQVRKYKNMRTRRTIFNWNQLDFLFVQTYFGCECSVHELN